MNMPTARKVSESETLMTHRALPEDANPAGNVHGGVILKHLDLAGGKAGERASVRIGLHRVRKVKNAFAEVVL